MKNNSFFKAGMLALALMFAMAVMSCPNSDPEGEEDPLPKLPSSTGTNEVGGKTYESSGERWEFSADGTYRYSKEDDDVWTEKENGTYSWNSSGAFKTVTLAPQRATVDGPTLYDKAGWKTATRSYFVDQGFTEADVPDMTEGQYTTITAVIDAFADYTFALQMGNYTMSGETIGTFVKMGTYGYADAKGGKVVVKNDTTDTLTVVTHDASGATNSVSPSAGESNQVFESAADTFLTEIEITTTSVRFTRITIESGSLFGGGSSSGFASQEGSSTLIRLKVPL
jgi:hypothetical protein